MSWQEAVGLIGGFALVSFVMVVAWPTWRENRRIRRSLRPGTTPIDPATGLRSGTDVGIVHSMDVGGSRNIAGQSDIRPDSIVTLKDNGCLNRTGVVLHVAEDRAVVRWRLPIPMVTVDLLSDLVLDVPTISPLAGVVR